MKSEQLGAISEALAAAQAEMQNPHFDAVNPHFKSKFASLAAVRAAVVPILSKHGIAITQWPTSTSGAAGCLTRLSHKSGEFMEEPFLIPVDKQNAHGYASAVTYAKRIAMQSVAGVVGEQDDDGNAAVEGNLEGKKPILKERNGPQGKYMAEQYTDKPWSAGDAIWDGLTPDMQTYLADIAANVKILLGRKKPSDALDEIESYKLADDAKACLWTRFDKEEKKTLQLEADSRKKLKDAA